MTDSPEISKRGAFTAIIGGSGQLELSPVEMEFYRRLQAAVTIDTNGAITLLQSLGSALGVGSGGTGLTTIASGAILYASALDTLAALAAPSANRVLTHNGTIPAWALIANANVDASAAIAYSKLNLTTSIVNGDISTSAAIAFSKLAQGSALSVLGVTGNAAAAVASIAAGSDHQVLRRSGTTVAFGSVNLAESAAVTGSLPVANGGTGRASHTAFAVLCGGTTSTAAQQSIAGLGSAGQVLTSNGAGALPTFQDASGGVDTSGTPADNQIAVFTDADTIEGDANFKYDGTTLTIPGQIAFPASQSASGGANVLDDYEEGTFTPRIETTTGETYTTQNGFYRKVGQVVYAEVDLRLASKGSFTGGNVTIAGFPFANNAEAPTAKVYVGIAMSTSYNSIGLLMLNSATGILFGRTAAATTDSFVQDTDISGTDRFQFSIVYRAAA